MRPRARTTSPARTRLVGAAVASAAGLALALAAPVAAQAHVELEASSAAPAALSVLTFAVGHGCEGSPTTSLAVTFPAEVQAVTPTVKPGWSITEAPAVSAVGAETTDTAETDTSPDTGAATGTTVTWTADPGVQLADGEFQRFSVSAGPVPEVDSVLLPVHQGYSDGTVVDWDEPTPASGEEPEHPAPELVVTEEASGGGHDAHGGSTSSGDEASGDEASGDDPSGATAAQAGSDPLAVGLGLGGLALGAVALVVAVLGLSRVRRTGAGR